MRSTELKAPTTWIICLLDPLHLSLESASFLFVIIVNTMQSSILGGATLLHQSSH